MIAALAGLLGAIANAIGSEMSRGLALRYPARQLIGPLFALNALLVLPAAPFVTWTWSPEIVAIHLVSVALLVITSLAIWDLYEHGSAAATVTAQSISPLPAALAVAVLLPGTLQPVQVVAAAVVVLAVLLGLTHSFERLGRRRSIVTVLAASIGTGLVTVMGRLLADRGAGVVEAYLVRAGLAAIVCWILVPPATCRSARSQGCCHARPSSRPISCSCSWASRAATPRSSRQPRPRHPCSVSESR